MGSQAFHRGGEIYIRADVGCGQLCFFNAITSQTNADIRNGFVHVASAILAHEQYHQLNPSDRREKPAYQREKDVFQKFEKKFNDQNRETYNKNLKDINDAINNFP